MCSAGAWLYVGGKKRYTPGKLCGGCPRTKSDAPRRVPYFLWRKKHTTRSVKGVYPCYESI